MVDRVTVYEAAKRLGLTESAIRQRIHRGKIESEKNENGKVWVYFTEDDKQSDSDISPITEQLIEELRDRIRFLEEELNSWKEQAARKDEEASRKDHIIMALTQRIPELEPVAPTDSSSEASESPVAASEEEGKGQTPPEPERAESEPWWRRIFR